MYSPQAPPRAFIFDLGDVLFTWSATTTTTVPARKLRDILSTPTWNSYERGEITRDACYERIAQQFLIAASEIAEAFSQARGSLQRDEAIIQLIHKLKKDPSIQLYAMSNIGKEDFEDLESKMDWSLFDRIFTSAAAGTRKPETEFYRYVLNEISLGGNQVFFIDDKEENIHAAREVGIQGLVFDESTIQHLHDTFNSPISKGWRYLFQNANHCDSVTSSGLSFADNFARLLILHVLDDRTLIDLEWGSKKTWNFFAGISYSHHQKDGIVCNRFRAGCQLTNEDSLTDEPPLISKDYSLPDDLDTTALALLALEPPSAETIASILDLMAEYVNEDGSFMTYFDREKARVDPIVSANVLACFYSYDRGHEFKQTLQLLRSMLLERSYIKGTRYYSSPDCCLGFIGRLLGSSSDSELHEALGLPLKTRLLERLGQEGSAMDLSMRVLACAAVDLPCEEDRRALLERQCEDGSWEAGWIYQYGTTGVKIGNRAATTAMAVAALSSPSVSSDGRESSAAKSGIEKL